MFYRMSLNSKYLDCTRPILLLKRKLMKTMSKPHLTSQLAFYLSNSPYYDSLYIVVFIIYSTNSGKLPCSVSWSVNRCVGDKSRA